ncbi:rhamnan synthesis F family protein [Halomonas sabkhae]|uniref:rhamnan synthesis F family protein n=1 Tax=Halomonas sabkhae TaxID=626223 RepID=UPI0025B2A09F|nr:rhamnan synthesis F family protein [Halomonas sabkhae]MDN3526614.1 rhamnan synthesis F family protein [Halomonas sabkhae]
MGQDDTEAASAPRPEDDLTTCLRRGLFDPEWYQQTYGRKFDDIGEAFEDYTTKSRFAPVNPSPAFDSESYFRLNMDVYHAQISPLRHFVRGGEKEGRQYTPAIPRWMPRQLLTPEREVGENASEFKVAVCLHIFYADFVDKYAAALDEFPVQVDVLLTLSDDEQVEKARSVFGEHPRVSHVETRVVPNRGRNFAPMLVEYAEELKTYDLFCHLHSKKSLYSGQEQTQWADYLTEYLLKDPSVVSGVLNAFAEDAELGVYYPTTFWMMPAWVNHVTMNAPFMKEWQEKLDLPSTKGFLTYPAGGMFWARPEALEGIISEGWQYEDFPEEPLPNDGSMLHALERVIGVVAEKLGYRQFFYYPPSGQFTADQTFITSSYHAHGIEQHQAAIQGYPCISFDVFDTLVRREFTVPDYAKLKLGQLLHERQLVESPAAFVKLRNEAELQVRKAKSFQGDVVITEVYDRLADELGISREEAQGLMQQEFELDLAMIQPKDEMVEFFNHLGSTGHKLWVISDTYYTRDQVGLMLKKAGIATSFRLMVSSEDQKRKDNGTMWHMVKEDLKAEAIEHHLHIGDNVVADAQLPGDLGLQTFHILHPMDKWLALGFPPVLQGDDALDEAQILKWGKLVSQVGRAPFIGE